MLSESLQEFVLHSFHLQVQVQQNSGMLCDPLDETLVLVMPTISNFSILSDRIAVSFLIDSLRED